jgi:hypothetical protein
MANLSQLIEAAVAAWRAQQGDTPLEPDEAAVVELDAFEIVITTLPRAPGETPAVAVEVIGGDGETLAEAQVELKDG